MAKRRGLFRRIADALFGREEPSKPAYKPRPTPATPVTPTVPVVNIGRLRQQTVRKIVSTLPYANRDTVARNVRGMDRDEMEWTLAASSSAIQQRAQHDADRIAVLPNGNQVPSNPWWYH